MRERAPSLGGLLSFVRCRRLGLVRRDVRLTRVATGSATAVLELPLRLISSRSPIVRRVLNLGASSEPAARRSTDQRAQAVVAFHRDGLGLEELARFVGHAGYAGVMLGISDRTRPERPARDLRPRRRGSMEGRGRAQPTRSAAGRRRESLLHEDRGALRHVRHLRAAGGASSGARGASLRTQVSRARAAAPRVALDPGRPFA
jgi:hypothetical protein